MKSKVWKLVISVLILLLVVELALLLIFLLIQSNAGIFQNSLPHQLIHHGHFLPQCGGISLHGPGGDADAGVKTSGGLLADADAFLACEAAD